MIRAMIMVGMAALLAGCSGSAVTAPAPSPSGSCHPAYAECLPVVSDLDCANISGEVHLTGVADPYKLDRDGDGVACTQS